MKASIRTSPWTRPVWGALAAAVLLGGCTQQITRPSEVASVAPQLSVERFLQASNERDLASMSRLFGTKDGPMGNTGSTFVCFFKKIGSWFGGQTCRRRQDVELQMATIANILRHDDYRITREEQVAGRDSPAMRVLVDITRGDSTVRGVPFIVVRSGGGQWLVENVDLERVMGGA
jgi:hypothetical protein